MMKRFFKQQSSFRRRPESSLGRVCGEQILMLRRGLVLDSGLRRNDAINKVGDEKID